MRRGTDEPAAPHYDNARFGETPVVHAVATHDEESGEVVVFAVNRAREDAVDLSIGLRAFPGHQVAEHLVLADDDVTATNTMEQPDRVTPRRGDDHRRDGDAVQVLLPAVSWNVIRLQEVPG